MAHDPDEDRIRRKAHELWLADGQPHGRDQDHWTQAREIIAIEDSLESTLLPRDTGAVEPVEPTQAVESLGDLPNLTDQGEHALTDISREPASLSPGAFTNATGDTTGAVARPTREPTPDIDDRAIVSKPATPQPVTSKPAAAVTSTPVAPTGTPGHVAGGTPAAQATSTPVPPAAPKPAAAPGKTVAKAVSGATATKVSRKASGKKSKKG